MDENLRKKEKECIEEFKRLSWKEESFMKQKSKVHWLKKGDQNTSYFHKCIKGRINRNTIVSELLWEEEHQRFERNLESVIDYKIPNDQATQMIKEVSDKEAREVTFSMGINKAPTWTTLEPISTKRLGIIGKNVMKAIKIFFENGRLLKKINCTIIALVAKCPNPFLCKDYRPISCCNTIHKCITKILANKLKSIFLSFVNKA